MSCYILNTEATNRFFIHSAAGFILEKLPVPLSFHNSGNYFMVCKNRVSEALVGLSNDYSRTYDVSWEFKGERTLFGRHYMVLEGWGDELSGGNTQFEGHEIAIERAEILKVLKNLIVMHPDLFNKENYAHTDGLENYSF